MVASNPIEIDLRALVYQEADWWIAHCLEMDIVAEGMTPREAMRSLDDLCGLQVKVALAEGGLESVFRPAPPDVWAMFCRGRERKMPRKPVKPVRRFEARELALV